MIGYLVSPTPIPRPRVVDVGVGEAAEAEVEAEVESSETISFAAEHEGEDKYVLSYSCPTEPVMSHSETSTWFAKQSAQSRQLIMLSVMSELTLVLRDVSTQNDKDLQLRVSWLISELNHRLLDYVADVMLDRPRYPDDVIMGILSDYLEHPDLEPHTGHVWQRAVSRAMRT